mmetsp:Transcript_7542/g.18704  ORF Transcript_7542/g.18704 Transcript_7542/m.18704 type:complete len:281 (-) Transcript_7542:959-1801(-)
MVSSHLWFGFFIRPGTMSVGQLRARAPGCLQGHGSQRKCPYGVLLRHLESRACVVVPLLRRVLHPRHLPEHRRYQYGVPEGHAQIERHSQLGRYKAKRHRHDRHPHQPRHGDPRHHLLLHVLQSVCEWPPLVDASEGEEGEEPYWTIHHLVSGDFERHLEPVDPAALRRAHRRQLCVQHVRCQLCVQHVWCQLCSCKTRALRQLCDGCGPGLRKQGVGPPVEDFVPLGGHEGVYDSPDGEALDAPAVDVLRRAVLDGALRDAVAEAVQERSGGALRGEGV